MTRALAKILVILAAAASGASAAAAGCNPPAGMMIQQWYSVCGGALQQAYSQGMGQGMPYENFVQSMYMVYLQPAQMPAYQAGPAPAPAGATCTPGATACFNGWLRTCQSLSYGTMWMTGSQRCD